MSNNQDDDALVKHLRLVAARLRAEASEQGLDIQPDPELLDAANRIEELNAENSDFASGACVVRDGIIGDEHGHFYCTLERQLAAAKADAERLAEALKLFVEGASHTQVFLRSREKMHPAGQDLYTEDVERARAALAAWEKSRG